MQHINQWPIETNASPAKNVTHLGSHIIIGILLLLVGLALIWLIPEDETTVFARVLGHLTIAVFVSGTVILAFEPLLQAKREQAVREFKEACYQAIRESLSAYQILFPEKVFDMLKNIAKGLKQTPTLYAPPRPEHDEYTFANDIGYFDSLVDMHRASIAIVLKQWIDDSDPNVKFLASDFIGKYKFRKLAKTLLDKASALLCNVEKLDAKQRSWVFNFIWAFSRCEEPMYETLRKELNRPNNQLFEKWILFIPSQMTDPEFVDILGEYVEQKEHLGEELFQILNMSLLNLDLHSRPGADELLKKINEKFATPSTSPAN